MSPYFPPHVVAVVVLVLPADPLNFNESPQGDGGTVVFLDYALDIHGLRIGPAPRCPGMVPNTSCHSSLPQGPSPRLTSGLNPWIFGLLT
ncbi:hypothetical protein I7I48_12030 [Histoplasma ohiense]|nr:hypothetical protein I7I48_12030 [Histoplasma ohiense (nom. inval.)]